MIDNSPLGPKKPKWPQKWVKSKVKIEGNIEDDSGSTTWVDPKTVFEPYLDLKNSPFEPQKEQRLRSKSKVIIEGSTENKFFSAPWLDPKIVMFSPKKKCPLRPPKAKSTLKLSQSQMSEVKKT